MGCRIDVARAYGGTRLEPRRGWGRPVVSPGAVSLRVIQCQLAVQPKAGPQSAAGGDLVLADKSVSHDLSLQRAKPARIVRGREIGQRGQKLLRGAEPVERPHAGGAHRALQ